ncbi:MAG: hypothetical protein JW940_30835 [Polyangiaceae bacterium]|nr:hypothetical protein [Polyangiaceae bacterium]
MRRRERSAERITPLNPTDEQRALELRRRLASMLMERMNTVRSAAQFVFRHHPSIVREVTSAYERRRRAAQRRKDAAVPDAQAAGGAATPAS